MASPSQSPSWTRAALIVLLLLLVGTSLWLSFSPAKQTTGSNAIEIESSSSNRDIAVIQAQLELEKARADIARKQIRIRQSQAKQNTTSPEDPELDRDEQKQRITEMIAAQLKGSEAQNQRLSEALAQKERELATIKAQNIQLQTKITALDDSTRTLLAALDPGQDISASDQNYLLALQGDTEGTNTRSDTAKTTPNNVDLINRIEVPDSKDTNSVTAQLRNRINQLMQDGEKPAPKTAPPPPPGSTDGDLQSNINALLDNRDERAAKRAAEKQFLADNEYLDSLNPMEEERSNETRWVTVRAGDTLSKIAQRVYNNADLYNKIYAANPQVLSNPDLIRTGQRLRVPN